MRLTCPTCGATYEIDGSLLPPGGRDVQCSNCGSTWFQDPPEAASEPEPAPEPAPAQLAPSNEAASVPTSAGRRRRRPDEAVLDVLRQEREHEARARAGEAAEVDPDPAPQQEAAPAEPDMAESAAPKVDAAEATTAPAPDPKPDGEETPEEIARRERARVAAAAALARARKRRGAPPARAAVDAVEDFVDDGTSEAITQALGEAASDGAELSDHPRDAMGQKQATASVAPPPAAESAPAVAETAGSAQGVEESAGISRRRLLPDIEEINSTLRPDERASEQAAAEAGEDPAIVAERRSGFRMGFSLVLILAMILVLVYSYAGPIGDAVPALAAPLDSYRLWGDGLRLALDSNAADLADWLTTSVGEN